MSSELETREIGEKVNQAANALFNIMAARVTASQRFFAMYRKAQESGGVDCLDAESSKKLAQAAAQERDTRIAEAKLKKSFECLLIEWAEKHGLFESPPVFELKMPIH